MRKNIRKSKQFFSIVLLCSLIVGSLGINPLYTKAVSEEEWTESTTTAPSYFTVTRNPNNESTGIGDATEQHWKFRENVEKVEITHGRGNGGERVQINQQYQPGDYDISLEFTDICKEGEEGYAFCLALGNAKAQWYDQKGYMIYCGESGRVTIIKTIAGDTNLKDNEIVAESGETQVSKINGTLSVNILLDGDKYIVTVNGESYEFSADWISNPNAVNVAIGFVNDFETLSEIRSWETLGSSVSFVLDKSCMEIPTESALSVRPFANKMAFMEGYSDGKFKPEQAITRREVIVALAKLLVDRADIQDVYTSDFADISVQDEDYEVIAYMERCGFLPDFGTNLNPEQAISRGEMEEMLEIESENENKGESVTRGEAAKIFCEYLGKTESMNNPSNTFSDVTVNTEYRDYILLATNEIAYRKESRQASTVDELQKAIEDALKLSETQDALVTIELTNSVYHLTEPIIINGASNGAYENAIVIKNATNVAPTITGNKDVQGSAFSQVSGKEYYMYQLPETAKVEGNYPEFRDLYLNGERLQLARSEEYTYKKSFRGHTSGEVKDINNWIYVDATIFKNINEDDLSTLELVNNYDFKNQHWRIAELHGIEANTGLMQISARGDDFNSMSDGNWTSYEGMPYWFENHLSLLDEPGEFYYDDRNGVIYFYPYKNIDLSNSVISYPVVDKLFDLQSTSGITFEGITFTGTTWTEPNEKGFNSKLGGTSTLTSENPHAAAIYSNYAAHLSVRNCTFDELGSNAVYLNSGNRNIVMRGNAFTNLAMSAIVMGKQSALWSLKNGQTNVIIDNNYIYNIGTDYQTSPGVYVTRVKNIAFTHNTVIHTPYTGVMMGWLTAPSDSVNVYNAEVAYNHLEDNVYGLNDGGGFYFCGANAQTNDSRIINRIHDNYIKGTGYQKMYNGIYLDINSSNYDVYSNVVAGFKSEHSPIFNQVITSERTYNNTVRENYTTVKEITADSVEGRNIQLIDNQMSFTYDRLPKEAFEIIDATGQQKSYQASSPKTDTVISMKTEETQFVLNVSERSEANTVKFEITNNSAKEASFDVLINNKNYPIQFESSTGPLVLEAGESGVINGCIYSDTETSQLVGFTVVRDDGWKMEFDRVVRVQVGGGQRDTNWEGELDISKVENGLQVTYGTGASTDNRVCNYLSYSLNGEGVEIELTDITSKDDDYAIGIALGNNTSIWYDGNGKDCYMLIYGRSGYFAIRNMYGEAYGNSIWGGITGSAEANYGMKYSTLAVEDRREPLGDKLSIHARVVGDEYWITVNGRTYIIDAKYGSDCCFAFGLLGDYGYDADGNGTSDGDYEKTWAQWGVLYSLKKDRFTIAKVAESNKNSATVVYDYTDTFSDYHNGQDNTAPEKVGYVFAGWYYDTEYTLPISEETTTLDVGQNAYAKFVDKDVLSVKVQLDTGLKTSDQSTNMRLVTSVDCQGYQEVGFAVTSRDGVTVNEFSRTKSYASIRGGGNVYYPSEYSQISKSLVTVVFEKVRVSNSLNGKITVQPYWETMDGTKVYGVKRIFTIQEWINQANK